MKYDDISPAMRAFIGGWEGFRKMGFRADDLFCTIARSARRGGVLTAFVTLRAQGKEFNLEVADVTDEKALVEEWPRICEAMNNDEISQPDMDRIWQESEIFQHPEEFAVALLAKGLRPPRSLS